jgi:uridine kinase
LDTGLLAEHLTALRLGRAVDVPRYDFATHSLVGGPAPTGPAPLVVVEGVLVLAVEELRSCLDLGVFVAARAEVRLERRLRRDVVQRGRDRESVLRQWHASVEPMHEALVGPSRRHAHVVVSGEEAESSSLAALVSRIRMALETRRD